jgi:hypothetical protein
MALEHVADYAICEIGGRGDLEAVRPFLHRPHHRFLKAVIFWPEACRRSSRRTIGPDPEEVDRKAQSSDCREITWKPSEKENDCGKHTEPSHPESLGRHEQATPAFAE